MELERKGKWLKERKEGREKEKMTRNHKPFPKESCSRNSEGHPESQALRYIFLVDTVGGWHITGLPRICEALLDATLAESQVSVKPFTSTEPEAPSTPLQEREAHSVLSEARTPLAS